MVALARSGAARRSRRRRHRHRPAARRDTESGDTPLGTGEEQETPRRSVSGPGAASRSRSEAGRRKGGGSSEIPRERDVERGWDSSSQDVTVLWSGSLRSRSSSNSSSSSPPRSRSSGPPHSRRRSASHTQHRSSPETPTSSAAAALMTLSKSAGTSRHARSPVTSGRRAAPQSNLGSPKAPAASSTPARGENSDAGDGATCQSGPRRLCVSQKSKKMDSPTVLSKHSPPAATTSSPMIRVETVSQSCSPVCDTRHAASQNKTDSAAVLVKPPVVRVENLRLPGSSTTSGHGAASNKKINSSDVPSTPARASASGSSDDDNVSSSGAAYPCGVCGQETEDTRCVACDRCDVWHHIDCIQLGRRKKRSLDRIEWYCAGCHGIVMKNKKARRSAGWGKTSGN